MSAHTPVQDDPRATLRGGLPDRYLTPDDIAEMFEVPLETVYQWRKKRTGPPGFRIGKHLRYDPADVHAYVTQRKDTDRNAA
ncbi:helix-turn-helix domain-containing protein [Streptomyces sp. G1]|uniref:helix-turn-helix domain-containing protein n=1 Tax=Streptomyces sp. G1 TaxID=361572 RepID=UPI00202FCBE1|nr:helix-turn-helix domain-containing protein [Streptomyces sp. G1]MCM1975338.1 helix-turn-helix domain-containing protein [Streptomyces sp. G1]